MADIAEAAGTSSGLVLYHFKSFKGALEARDERRRGRLLPRWSRAEATHGPADAAAADGASRRRGRPAVGDWSLWLEIWVRALRDPGARATRELLTGGGARWLRDVIDEGVGTASSTGRRRADAPPGWPP